jgi:hypothetical protein
VWERASAIETSHLSLRRPCRLVNKLNLFVLEVVKAWTDPAQKHPKTIHHHGYGRFRVDGEMIKLKSRMP